jgi:hypothetical protein
MFRPYFGHHQGYTDIVASLFTHSLGINVQHYAVYSNWQSPIAKITITVYSILRCIDRASYHNWKYLFSYQLIHKILCLSWYENKYFQRFLQVLNRLGVYAVYSNWQSPIAK